MANANAADFNNSAYLTRGGALTGAADGTDFAFAFWFLRSGTGIQDAILSEEGNDFFITFLADNTVRVFGETIGGTDLVDLVSNTTFTDTANWGCLMGSFTTGDAANGDLYFGDTDVLGTVTTDAAGDISFERTEWGIGALFSGSLVYDGSFGPYWFDLQRIDFSVQANRRVFFGPNGKVPQALNNSTDGNVGGFGQPLIFQNNPTASWQINLGSGGGFTENNALAAVTGPEVEEGTVILRRRREVASAH